MRERPSDVVPRLDRFAASINPAALLGRRPVTLTIPAEPCDGRHMGTR